MPADPLTRGVQIIYSAHKLVPYRGRAKYVITLDMES
jgi:hypothetical protein